MEIVDVVRKLTGAIEPVGETHTDGQRLDNLKVMTALVDELLDDISGVSRHMDSGEYSRQQAARHAVSFLKHVTEEYGE